MCGVLTRMLWKFWKTWSLSMKAWFINMRFCSEARPLNQWQTIMRYISVIVVSLWAWERFRNIYIKLHCCLVAIDFIQMTDYLTRMQCVPNNICHEVITCIVWRCAEPADWRYFGRIFVIVSTQKSRYCWPPVMDRECSELYDLSVLFVSCFFLFLFLFFYMKDYVSSLSNSLFPIFSRRPKNMIQWRIEWRDLFVGMCSQDTVVVSQDWQPWVDRLASIQRTWYTTLKIR